MVNSAESLCLSLSMCIMDESRGGGGGSDDNITIISPIDQEIGGGGGGGAQTERKKANAGNTQNNNFFHQLLRTVPLNEVHRTRARAHTLSLAFFIYALWKL